MHSEVEDLWCVAGISLGYRTDLHIFAQGSVMLIWYRDEGLEPIVRLCAAAVGLLLF